MRYFNDKETIVSNEIEWLPSIPKSWNLCRLKDFASIETGIKNTEDKIPEGIYPFFVRSQTVEYSDTFSFEGEAILTAGDGVGVGKVFHHYNGKFETHQRVYRICKFKKLNGRFLFYFISENLSKEALKYNSKATVDSLRMPTFQRFPLVLPPLEEQSQIAQYLDTKTQAIDKKINLLTKKAQTYKELRKSIINDAVCRGLDNKVKLKDSGIEWLGKIPQHWLVVRGKNLFDEYGKSKITATEGNSEGKYKFFTSSNEQSKWLDYFQNDKEAILFSTGGCAGVNYCDKEYSYSTDCWAIFGNKQTFLKFFAYYFETIINEIQQKGFKGSSLEHLHKDFIKLSEIILPPVKEQIAIAAYLDEKSQKIDAIVTNIGKQIETLKELRKTLINDVVTGKIKVTK
jgi:type I restriction enzyme S subunit